MTDHPDKDRTTANPDVSIIVCTYNRAHLLRDALKSLSQLQTNGAFAYEIVVVDNASTDTTPAVVAAAAKHGNMPIRHVIENNQGVAYARNHGIGAARGEWIAFFDDDQLADPAWLLQLRRIAAEKTARCVGGAVRLRLPTGVDRKLTPICRMLLGETVAAATTRPYDLKFTPGTGNLMVHREVFDEVGLFDESLNQGGEDTELFMRIQAAEVAAWYTPDAIVHHMIPQERLRNEYLIAISKQMIQGLPKIDRQNWGPYLFPLIAAARIARAVLWTAPQFAFWSWSNRDPEAKISARCRLAVAAAYADTAIGLLSPRWLTRWSANQPKSIKSTKFKQVAAER